MVALKIRHSGIVVKNLEESLTFYRDKLGFRVTVQAEESGFFIDTILGIKDTIVVTVKMECVDGQKIELLDYRTNKRKTGVGKINDMGLTHIAFEVKDLGALYRKFCDAGIKFISAPAETPDGFAKVAFCRAPEGTYIELVEMF